MIYEVGGAAPRGGGTILEPAERGWVEILEVSKRGGGRKNQLDQIFKGV